MPPVPQHLEFMPLWSAHARQVYSYIFSLVADCNDADDVFQETSITLMQKFSEFDPATSFSAWACRVAYFKSLSQLKTRRSHEHLDEAVLAAIESTVSASLVDGDARFEALGQCLSMLPAKDRQLVELRYRQDLSVDGLAKKVGRNLSAVYKSLSRIHDSLMECVRRRIAERGSS